MLSLFTALFTNAMQASLDGTRCRDIGGKKVSNPNMNTIPKTLCTLTSLCPFLHTFLYIFPKMLEKNVFLSSKSFFSW